MDEAAALEAAVARAARGHCEEADGEADVGTEEDAVGMVSALTWKLVKPMKQKKTN